MNSQTAPTAPMTHDWLDLVVCPRDKKVLELEGDFLVCPDNHRYRVVEGVPILLVSEAEQTHIEGTRALAVAESGDASQLARFQLGPGDIDPFVKNVIGATNGGLYKHLVGNLKEYPIPELRLPPSQGGLLLDVGSNWGRWCLAAQRLGYRPVGIDPSLKSVRAARRVAQQLGVRATYIVADGRFLPFPDEMFHTIFSYSVLQHLSKTDAATVLAEICRALTPGGECLVQLPNVFGLRCLYHQARRGFRETREFEVRYWTVDELKKAFARIGPARVSVDGFFSLNAQISDVHLMPPHYRAVVYASEGLRRISETVRPLMYVADSLYVSARKAE